MLTPQLSRRTLLAAAGSLLAVPSALALSRSERALYQARTIVTGQRPETRNPGLQRCLAEVIVRVSGDQRLASAPALQPFFAAADAPVLNIGYRDLYAMRKIADEQGTRDRPYEMTVAYDAAKIDAMLKVLGSRPWLGDRPRLAVFLAVHHIGSRYILTGTAEAGDLQRQSFQDASWKYALEVVIPSEYRLQQAGLTIDNLPNASLRQLRPLTDASVGETPLLGLLAWDKALLGWKARWRIAAGGEEHSWGIEGVNFDAAFRNAVGGAAQLLSANGTPG